MRIDHARKIRLILASNNDGLSWEMIGYLDNLDI